MSKILITGSNGFLGARILEAMLEEGHEITATARQSHSKYSGQGFRFISTDLTLPECIEKLTGTYDYIIHCAAKSSPWGTYDSFYEANVRASAHILAIAEKSVSSKIILISTPSIYFEFRDKWDIKEDDPLPEPMINHYATTKYMAECALLASSVPVIALRPRALIGRGDTIIMPRVLNAYHQGKLKVIGDGKNIVDLTPVANVVKAVTDAMNAPETAWNQAYNITSGHPVNLWGCITEMLHALDLPFKARKVPYFLADYVARMNEKIGVLSGKEPALLRYSVGILYFNMTMDISKARKLLHFEPVQTVEEGMKEFLAWWKNKEL